MAHREIPDTAGNTGFFASVYEIVKQIPPGKVTTYGRIADMLGYFRGARTVGWAMSVAPHGLPCHRVVDHLGRTLCKEPGQRENLESEGIHFTDDGRVDLAKHLW